MINFPALSAITMRKSFEPLNKGSWCTSNVPPDKVLYTNDRLMGNPITYTEVQDFADCVTTLTLNELAWTGDCYTWSNKKYGAERIISMIDRAFGNYEWMMQWGHVITEFFNVWADHDSFISIIERVWNQSYTKGKMKNIWVKLKELRPLFRSLNTEHFRTISMKIEQARISLEEVQQKINATYNDSLIEEEKSLLQNLEKWSLIKERDKLIHPESIKQEVVEFYKSLMGSAAHFFPAINKVIMKNGPILSQQQKLALCVEVTDKEIYTELCAIDSDKTLVIDGYNACFFKKAWVIIKKNTIKDYRPIACCSILYKLISKVLAGRIQQIIASVISEAQASFISGRRIADNIILAHMLVKAYTRKNIFARCMIKIDLQKAYDSVEWSFLEQVLIEMGFLVRFVNWIMECITTVNYIVMVN
ncbi:uncharacterized protein LOC142162026 [Nicotiana tabacum]|uniref:Uncharacterized protein LOC142162026 n=1 Tax=Nicotiana tabacum TaxID=4097 RepID=A0AC58RNW7_TOBAC